MMDLFESLSQRNFRGARPWHGTMTSVVCAGDGYLSKVCTKELRAMQSWYY